MRKKIKKIWLISVIIGGVIGVILTLGAPAVLGFGPLPPLPIEKGKYQNDRVHRIFSDYVFIERDPIEVERVIFPAYQARPGEEIIAIYLIKNRSWLTEKVSYHLKSNLNLGVGEIKAIIDKDGPFGPKNPEPYIFGQKVSVPPYGTQYLYISIIAPHIPDLFFYLDIDRWLEP